MPKQYEIITNLININDEQKVRSKDWYEALQKAINQLINDDFGQLVQVLYRVDVSEEKLKNLLRQNPNKHTGTLISNLLLERQLEKIKWRKSNENKQPNHFTEEEKW